MSSSYSFHEARAASAGSIFVLLLVLILPTATLSAQQRTLSWPSVTVTAHLDAEGRLRVRERQEMRFNGDWNGGERKFDVGLGQSFAFDSIVRVDPSGITHRLREGDLSRVDQFDWPESRTLRWRSRLPDDPPFENDVITYELSFNYDNILEVESDSIYVLDHDFGFSDREGEFERFALTLTIDPAWRAPADFTGRWEQSNIPPGDEFVVTIPLTRVAASRPASVWVGASNSTRLAFATLLIIGAAIIVLRLLRHDARLGRFTPGPPSSEVTPGWLSTEVFAHLPEVIGTAWDDTTSEAEVAATLARLVQEGKLESRVESSKVLVFSRHVLHLELKVPRDDLVGHERTLVDALFGSDERTTNTEAVRERYRKSGFDPAALIRSSLKKRADALTPRPRRKKSRSAMIPTLVLVVTAVSLVVGSATVRVADLLAALAFTAASLPVYGVGMLVATDWRTRVRNVWTTGSVLLVIIAVLAIAPTLLMFTSDFRFGPLALAGMTAWVLALINSICNHARLSQTAERIALRKRLAAAREYFQGELNKPAPHLTDSVYPYLLAFGLGKHVDRWFKAFGGAAESTTPISAMRTSSTNYGGGSSDGRAPFGGFGGGGGFSGGGGGLAFGAAIGGMASSVPSPSSSSSGGGSSSSSSGGSSGGGGGGGW